MTTARPRRHDEDEGNQIAGEDGLLHHGKPRPSFFPLFSSLFRSWPSPFLERGLPPAMPPLLLLSVPAAAAVMLVWTELWTTRLLGGRAPHHQQHPVPARTRSGSSARRRRCSAYSTARATSRCRVGSSAG